MPEPTEASEETQAEETPTPEPRKTLRFDWRARALEDWRFVVAGTSLVLGIVLVVLGWYGAAYTNIITEQIPYLISGGLLGLGLIILAGVMAASGAQRRDNQELRRELARSLDALGSAPRHSNADLGAGTPSHSANGYRVFVLPGGKSFHEAGCPIIEGKPDVTELARADAAGSGLATCKLCGPND
ncbi:MAG TPA: hypothetical protein VGB52_12830 [Actinomycetota bacterium]